MQHDETTQVEIFLEEDTNTETLEIPEEILQKTNECIAEIEKNLSIEMYRTKMDAVLDGKVIPFHKMSAEECRMWGAVCPHRFNLDVYEGYIPVRVLQALKLVTEKEMFHHYVIYSEYSDQTDPILIGFLDPENKEQSWRMEAYLIARWGKSLFSVAELKDRALKAVTEKIKAEALEAKTKLDILIASPEVGALTYLIERGSLPYINLSAPTTVSG